MPPMSCVGKWEHETSVNSQSLSSAPLQTLPLLSQVTQLRNGRVWVTSKSGIPSLMLLYHSTLIIDVNKTRLLELYQLQPKDLVL